MQRPLGLDRVDNGVPGEDVCARKVDVQGRQSGPVTHRLANGHRRLVGRGELWPVAGDRRIEIESSLLREQVDTHRHQALRTGEDHSGGIAAPRARGPGVGNAAPEVDQRATAHVHGAARPDVSTLDEVRDEGIHHGAVPRVHEPLDPTAVLEPDAFRHRVRQRCWVRHPFTDPWRSAAITWRWKRMKTTRVGRRITIVPAHSSGMSVA